MIPLIEPIRWMALGAALALPSFARRLVGEVGPRAFQGPSSDVYGYVEMTLAGINQDKWIREVLGLRGKDGDKLSNLIIKTLIVEAKCAWDIADPRTAPDQKLMLELSTDIAQKSALLAAWAKRMKQ